MSDNYRFTRTEYVVYGYLFLAISSGSAAYALPVGGSVAAGGASMVSNGGSTTITQATPNVVINWQGFNIGQSETVRFIQPDLNSVALNRVQGADPSSILGGLTSNGKVFLVNPNGILFGKHAQVNVGGLVASTLNITDSDFMAGSYRFAGTGRSTILNQGLISTNANGGYVALIGANVSNEGLIAAKLGTVALAAGTVITLDVAGDGLLNVAVNQGAVNALVKNGGMIQADGGEVLLTAQAAGNLLQSVVNNTGVIQAQTIERHQGKIRLLADMQSGTVEINGTLTATGGTDSGDGGFIETSAHRVLVDDNARVDTLAAQGKTGLWLLDPVNWTIATTGGDETPASVISSLATTNRLIEVSNDITVASPVAWASAQTLTLNAGHDVLINAPLTAVPAGAGLVLTAANNVNVSGALTATAANSSISISAGNDVNTSAIIMAVAADSSITIRAGNDLHIGGAITGTAATTLIDMSAVRDVVSVGAITAVAANSLIKVNAGRDLITSAAMLATAAGTSIDLGAGRNLKVNAAIAASAAGSSISLIAGLDGSGPGVTGGTVSIGAAVASLNTTIRFNPNGYAATNAEIAAYVTAVTGAVDAKAWVFAQGNNKVYDGTNAATISLKGNPGASSDISISPGIALFDTSNAGPAKSISFFGTTMKGADAGKFVLVNSSGNTTADINRAPLIVTVSGNDKVYDSTSRAVVTLSDNRIFGDAFTVTNAAANFADQNAGNGKVVSVTGIKLTGADAANYNFMTEATTAANITPAPLKITALNATKIYGQTPALSGFTQIGLLNNETIGSVTEDSPGKAAKAGVTGGPYTITASNAAGGSFNVSNYSINYVNGTLTVTPAKLTVTVANATKIYGQSMILTAFSTAGLLNGDTVGSFSESSPGTAANATVAGSPYVITPARAAGGTFIASNYSINYVNGLLTVTPLIQFVPVGAAMGVALPSDNTITPIVVLSNTPAELLAIAPLPELPEAEPVK
jgi:filamentous hemagglutinin family protein